MRQRRTWDEFKSVLSVASQPVEQAENLENRNQLSGMCWGAVYCSIESYLFESPWITHYSATSGFIQKRVLFPYYNARTRMETKRQVECFSSIRTMQLSTQQQLLNVHFTPSLSYPASLSEMVVINTTPKTEAARSPGTFKITYPITWCHNQRGQNLNKYKLHFKIVNIVRIFLDRDKLLGGLPRMKVCEVRKHWNEFQIWIVWININEFF